MAFKGLTSGERKRLRQGILTPEQATLVSARATAKNPEGFWSSTWGQVIRGVGISVLSAIPYVGSAVSAGVGAYDRNRAANAQRAANSKYADALRAAAQPPQPPRSVARPFLDTLPGAWSPDYGVIGGGTAQAGVGGSSMGSADSLGAMWEDVVSTVGSWEPWQWLLLAGLSLLLIGGLTRGK